MANEYMVVRLDANGCHYDDPMAWDTKEEAIEYADKSGQPPPGGRWAMYRLEYVCDPTNRSTRNPGRKMMTSPAFWRGFWLGMSNVALKLWPIWLAVFLASIGAIWSG